MKHVYLWSTVIGAILGGIPAIYYVDDIWRQKPIQGGFEFMRWVVTVIVLLAVPVGAMCGAALAALLHLMVWDANTAKELQMLKARKLAAETDHGRGAGAP